MAHVLGYRSRGELMRTMPRREYLYWKGYRQFRLKLKEEAAKKQKQLVNWWE